MELIGNSPLSPCFLRQPCDGCMLSAGDLRLRMGMFEEKLTPIVPAIFSLTGSQNESRHAALLGSGDGFSQLVKRAVWAIEASDLV